jgi:hypothetical protein
LPSIQNEIDSAIVLTSRPYSDGKRVVRVMSRTHGTIALWVNEGRGKNRRIAMWHAGALLELSGMNRKGSEGLIRFREARRTVVLDAVIRDPRRSAIVFFICEVIEKTMAEETPHPEVQDLLARTICEIESSASLGWIHAAFLGQLIRLLGIAPVSPGNSDFTSLDLPSGDWKYEIGLEKESLEKSIADGFMAFLEPEAAVPTMWSIADRKRLILGQVRYLQHQLGSLREIKSYAVLEAVFDNER